MKRSISIVILGLAVALLFCLVSKAVAGDEIVSAYQHVYTTNTGSDGDDVEFSTPPLEAQHSDTNTVDIEAAPQPLEAQTIDSGDRTDIEAAPTTVEVYAPDSFGSSGSGSDVIIHFDPSHGAIDCIRNPGLCHGFDVPGSSDDMPEGTSDSTGGTITGPGGVVGTIESEIPTIGRDIPTRIPSIDMTSDDSDTTDDTTNCRTCNCTSPETCPQAQADPAVVPGGTTDTGLTTNDFMVYQGVGGCSLMSTNPSSGILSALILALCALPIAFVRKIK